MELVATYFGQRIYRASSPYWRYEVALDHPDGGVSFAYASTLADARELIRRERGVAS